MSESLVDGAAIRPIVSADDVPIIDFDPYAAEVMSDPYPYYARLREASPIAWSKEYGVYAIGRYDAVTRVLTDHEAFCSSAGVGLTNFHTENPWRKPSIILEVDPPEHSRTRKVFSRILSPRALNKLRERFEQEAEKLVAKLLKKGEFAGVRDLAEALC